MPCHWKFQLLLSATKNTDSKLFHQIQFYSIQLVKEPTHIEGHILDQAYLQKDIKNIDHITEIHAKYYSDHRGLSITINKR